MVLRGGRCVVPAPMVHAASSNGVSLIGCPSKERNKEMVSLIELAQIVLSQGAGEGNPAGPMGGIVNLVPMVLIILLGG